MCLKYLPRRVPVRYFRLTILAVGIKASETRGFRLLTSFRFINRRYLGNSRLIFCIFGQSQPHFALSFGGQRKSRFVRDEPVVYPVKPPKVKFSELNFEI